MILELVKQGGIHYLFGIDYHERSGHFVISQIKVLVMRGLPTNMNYFFPSTHRQPSELSAVSCLARTHAINSLYGLLAVVDAYLFPKPSEIGLGTNE